MTNNEKIFNLAKYFEFDRCEIISTEPFWEYKKEVDDKNCGDDFNIKYDPKEYKTDGKYIIVMIKSYKPYDEKYFSEDHIYVDSYYITGNACYFNAKKMTEEMQNLGYKAYFSPQIPYKHCALRAGIGIKGMNSLIINKEYGSYFHIQCIMTDMPLDITSDVKNIDSCTECDKCIKECMGNAIDSTGNVDKKKCIRHYMPARRYMPVDIRTLAKNSLIGCMRCRIVCPYNKKIQSVKPPDDLLDACYIPILMDKDHVKHKKHFKILQNYIGTNEVRQLKLFKSLAIIAGNIGDEKYSKLLNKIKAESTDKDLLEYVDWAIGEIAGRLDIIDA